jgi:hypothetical protein
MLLLQPQRCLAGVPRRWQCNSLQQANAANDNVTAMFAYV